MAADSNGSSIKLFGKTIPFPLQQPEGDLPNSCKEISDENGTTSLHERKPGPEKEEQKCYKKEIAGNRISDNNISSNQMTKDSKYRTSSSGNSENPKTESEMETSSLKCSKNTEQSDSSTSQEKAPKKPDKILPCPRCNSMETKFCYHNNYNVNQPRHFCKNCQRHWTAGGTMRNVPVGSGRRKKKSSSASQYRQMMVVPEALRPTQVRAGNGTFLTFGFESPLCESAASVLSLSEETRNIVRNGYHGPENKVLVSGGGSADNGNDKSRGSITNSLNSSSEKRNGSSSQQAAARKSHQGFPQPFSSFAGPPWPCPWNLAMPAPTSCPSGFPVSFYPTPIWVYTVPSPWNAPPLVTPTSLPSPLGKHSRDGKILFPASPEVHPKGSNSSERNILVLKTLGIDDPREAAKSSIWKTIDNKMENIGSVTRGGLFMGFQSQIEDRNSMMTESSKVLQANPAAFSRSLKFHEST